MTRGSGWMFLACVFIAGVFFGIWMDWSAHKHLAGGRDFFYQVQDYQMANLMVRSGDRIHLLPPEGGNGAGLLINFLGGPLYNPCENAQAGGVNPCVIKAGMAAGGYLFTCNSSQGYSCPDPGIQQQPTGPIEGKSYHAFVKTDFSHLFGIRRNLTMNPEPTAAAGTHPAISSVRAYVSCSDKNTTILQDPAGKDQTIINAAKGDSVFWISPMPFSLDLSSAPAGFCTNGNPTGGGPQPAQCDIGLSGQTVQYKVQALTSPACSALAATLVTK
jgi:hypothetical protein